MKNPTKKLLSIALTALTSFNVLSPVVALENDKNLEEIKVKKVNKKGNLIVKFCSKLKDFEGFVKIDDQNFQISNADIVKPRKIIWKDVNLPKQKGENIITDNLIARYHNDENNSQQLRFLDDGECGVGILPFILVGVGIGIGAGSGGSGSSSSN